MSPRWVTVTLPLLLAGCVNHPNTWMPQGERKPFLGPEPKDHTAAVDLNKQTAKETVRLYRDNAQRVKVTCDGTVRVFVNARAVGAGACPISAAIPAGTLVPKTVPVIEIEADAPVLLKRVELEP
jgi:hypothetical protein